MIHILFSLGGFTQASIIIILALAIGLHIRWSRRIAVTGPALLTTFGIFFCFAGITWGLTDFDPADVRDSVPALLQGIRTSFWASVFGIGCALTIKLRLLIFGQPPLGADGATAGATVDDLVAQVRELNRHVGGANSSSLLERVEQSRADSNVRLESLGRTLESFSTHLVHANSEALIAALSQVVRDFNHELNEQFGQNFINLNLAVERLVIWQRQYERQLNSLIEQETQTRNNLADASLQFAAVVNKAGAFAANADALHELLVQSKSQTERLNGLMARLNKGISDGGL